MEKKKIVFFVANLTARPHRRIQETISHGFDVDVYCLCEEQGIVTPDYEVCYFAKDEISNLSYIGRVIGFLPKIWKCVHSYDLNKTIFYFFSLNTGFFSFFKKMTYVYEESDMLFDRFANPIMQRIVKAFNLRVIKRSKVTVFTSEGFALYYYGTKWPSQILFIPNKVNAKCLSLPKCTKSPCDINHIRFGFVGKLRYKTLYNFAEVVSSFFPQHEFHFYGKNGEYTEDEMEILAGRGNVFFHGAFKNPEDLSAIYSKLDFVVATYDTTGINPRYAEPNKVYESIFFRTPIIVSRNSFLENKVEKLNIGLAVNALDKDEIFNCIKGISKEMYDGFICRLSAIDRNEAVGMSDELFDRLSSL